MSNVIAIPNRDEVIVAESVGGGNGFDDVWWRVFDVKRAVGALDDVCKALPSDRNKVKSSRASYEPGLLYFLNWAGPGLSRAGRLAYDSPYEFIADYPKHRFPGVELVQEYIGHLNGRGLAGSTIQSRYLTPLSHYLKALKRQAVPVRGEARDFVLDCKEQFGLALELKPPKTESAGHLAPLQAHGNRLSVAEVDAVFTELAKLEPGEDLAAARDLALLYVGFNAALRLAELRRMTLGSLKQGDDGWEIHVRGKRNNRQPVPLDGVGYQLIMRWVEAYNGGLEPGDGRRIGQVARVGDEVREVPLWQPLYKDGRRVPEGAQYGPRLFDPFAGMGTSSVRDMVGRRTEAVLGRPISPHDMRRTAAFLGRKNGMDYDQLQVLLRHKNISTTKRYVGNPYQLSKSLLSNVVEWSVGDLAS